MGGGEVWVTRVLILRHQQYVTDRQTFGEGGLEFDEIQTLSVPRRRIVLWVTHNKETLRSKAVTAMGSKIVKGGSLQK